MSTRRCPHQTLSVIFVVCFIICLYTYSTSVFSIMFSFSLIPASPFYVWQLIVMSFIAFFTLTSTLSPHTICGRFSFNYLFIFSFNFFSFSQLTWLALIKYNWYKNSDGSLGWLCVTQLTLCHLILAPQASTMSHKSHISHHSSLCST